MHASRAQSASKGQLPTSRHDVVVVGARCAGAATAMLLARAGHDVVLLDKARLPGDTTSTHSLSRGGLVQLARWGLLDEVLASGAPPIRTVAFHRYDTADAPLQLEVKAKVGIDHLLAPRRHILDQILVEAAVRAGVTLRDQTLVRGVVRDADARVTGVTVADPDGLVGRVDARMVVGADGVRSRMADHLGAVVQERHAPSGTCLYTYVAGVDWNGYEFHLGDGAFAGVFPTHFGQACVWLIRPADLAHPILTAGASRLSAWLETLQATVPGLADRVRAGSVEAPLRGAVGLPNHVRRAAGPGWALVGDAGYHRDPITGHGMTDAFRDADLLAGAVDLALRTPSAQGAALATYQRERDTHLAPTFRITRALGAFPRPDRFVALQAELSRALDTEAEILAARPARLDTPEPVAC